MAAIAVAGVSMMMVCSSSSVAALMMGGEEETPTPQAGPSAGPSAPDETFTIPTDQDSLNECYAARYKDLRAAFGHQGQALNNHYTTHTTNGAENRSNSCTLSDEEAQRYLDRYPAVQAYAGTNLELARKHYYEVGMGEHKNFSGNPGPEELICYLQRYPDLQNAFGTDYDISNGSTSVYKAMQHWGNHGQGEGRDFSCP
tara:strand:+ start:75 stop:674 length:600 start_codon:yes stop_codon:yes gene_type:complete